MAGPRVLDVDDILAGEERVPVSFIFGALKLGHLDPSCATEDVDAGHEMDVPLWLAKELKLDRFVSVKLPKNYSTKVRENLIADPDAVNLRDKSPHFYETGLELAALSVSDDAARLPAAIKATLASRMHKILTRSHNSLNSDVSDFVGTLTDLEQRLFWQGYAHVRDRLAWKKRLTTVVRREGALLGSSGGEGLGIGVDSRPKRQRIG